MDAEDGGDREARGDEGLEDQGDDGAQRHTGGDADKGERADLDQVGQEDRAAGGAEGLQRRDDRGLTIEIGADGGRHAHTADREPGEADEDEEGGQPVDEALDPGRAGAAVAPAAAFERGLRLGLGGGEVGLGGQAQAIGGLVERAGGEEARAVEVGGPDERAGAEGKAAAGVVGLSDQRGGQAEVLRAEADGAADVRAEPLDQDGVHDRTGQRAVALKRVGERHRRVEADLAVERIGAVDALHLRQAARVARGGHGPEVDDLGQRGGAGVEPGAFVGGGESVGEFDLGVAAEQDRALAVKAGTDRLSDRADGGDGGDPEDQAGEEHAEAADAAAEFAARDPKGDGEVGHDARQSSGPFIRRPGRGRVLRCVRRSGGSCGRSGRRGRGRG